jgi:hypothetical protein
MTLTCKLKDGSQKVVRILIDPPLSGYEEVKPRLLAMKADAQEGLGMVSPPFPLHSSANPHNAPPGLHLHKIRSPQISTFRLPLEATTTALAMGFLCYVSFFPRDSTSLLFRPAHFVWSVTGKDRAIMAAWWVAFVLHGLETVYMYSLCRKHRTGFWTGVSFPPARFSRSYLSILQAAYCFSTLLFGFPIFMDFRKRVQAARIESVMKVE